jgi:N-acetyl-anhydromuramyl-L-alanine amidase AmpD
VKTKEIQERLKALGYDPGPIDGIFGPRTEDAVSDFQGDHPPLVVDGDPGPLTQAMLRSLAEEEYTASDDAQAIPDIWLPPAKVTRLILHWSAGSYKASASDKEHYHLMVQGDGTVVRGDHTIDDNNSTGDGDYAAHTSQLNTGSVGLSMCCMAGAEESPFDPGPYPMLESQWKMAAIVAADVCRAYDIRIDKSHVLSHAEVQPTLGITQRGKWDVARLPWDLSARGAIVCGDIFRELVRCFT